MAKKACGAAVSSLLFLFACLCGAVVSAENKPLETKGPVVITSSSLTADNKAHTALFEGTVVAKSDDMTISSDRMLVTYTEGGAITRIDAEGNVKLIRSERVITADAATYFADEEKVVFTGEPRAAEGGNVVTGTKMIYLMKEDRSIVENSKVFIKDRKGK
ncbi:MAG TPA: LptA/OstA family protein [Thermodesulfovibrionales bacterium]|jgi:lipopolysaccharide export system protein LptA|nr:LptA/OstA family protein [Thermodesulfovibrionales bacterium]